MAQLIVRRIEDEVVAKLRRRAARHGVSMEEEHRRILRDALSQSPGVRRTLKQYLEDMPDVGTDEAFERLPARLRRVDL